MRSSRPPLGNASGLSYRLLTVFLVVLWFAGGASRADAAGQAIVRLVSWGCLAWYVLAEREFDRRSLNEAAIAILLIAFAVSLQLVPLPPALWSALPGREVFVQAIQWPGGEQPWRPLSISPSATVNALSSLVVPFTVAVLAGRLDLAQQAKIAALLVALAIGGTALALVEFSGRNIDQPFINDPVGAVSGNFANRNHFALFLAQGVVLLMAWVMSQVRNVWIILAGAVILLLFMLTGLATGSRTGIVLVTVGFGLGLLACAPHVLNLMRSAPRRYVIGSIVVTALVTTGVLGLAYAVGRADAISRIVTLSGERDMRAQVWPLVMQMIGHYFPAGTGFGTFDPVFRISEPQALLNLEYRNRVHNDWLEIVLDGGVLGLALLAGGFAWFALRSWQAWFPRRAGGRTEAATYAKAGSAIILLTLVASVTDYPGRTPMIMATLAFSAVLMSPRSIRDRVGERLSRTSVRGFTP